MANKITCTCGHSWNKSDSSKKDATVCHVCGKNNMKDGGWLSKYETAQNGIEGTMGGLTDQGFDYNGAWGGTMQMGGSMPGAVGFTYARTGGIPSNGPYAKKTMASAQKGASVSDNTRVKPVITNKPMTRETVRSTEPFEPKDNRSIFSDARAKERINSESGDFVQGLTTDTAIDQIPYSAYALAAKAINEGKPLTAISELVKQPLHLIGDVIVNALQENPKGIDVKTLEENTIPYARLAANALFGNPVITQIGRQRIESGKKKGSKWYQDFELPTLTEAAESYGVDGNTFTQFIEDNWNSSGGSYKKILELADKKFPKKQNGGNINKAQDGKEVEYKELPEITVVGSKDKQTRDFYNNLIDKFSEGEPASAENPFIDARVMGQYLGMMNMGKEYGFPKVKPETKSGIYRNAKGHYNPLTETIYANDVPTWVSEMAHRVQMKDNIVGKGLQWLGNDLIEYIKQPIASIKGEKLPSPYTTEGTVEHEAHSIIQPMLEERAMKDYEKYRDSELAKSREKRFLHEKRNLQNGGEMKFYQEGLDWTPKNISQDGSKTKKKKTLILAENDPELWNDKYNKGKVNPFITEAAGIKKYVNEYFPDEDVEIVPAYKDSFNEALKRSDANTRLVTLAHAGNNLFGVPVSEYLQSVSKTPYQNCYAGTCYGDDIVEGKFGPTGIDTRNLNNFNVRSGHISWSGFAPVNRGGEEGFKDSFFRRSKNPEIAKLQNEWTSLSKLYDLKSIDEKKFIEKSNELNIKMYNAYKKHTINQEKATDVKTYNFVPYPARTDNDPLRFNPQNILQQKKQGGEITKDDNGYWNPDNWGEPVEIGSNEITMEGVYEPLLGISDTGDTQMMYPGEDYTFDGESVTEYPVMQKGGSVPTTADSINIYNYAVAQDNYYRKNIEPYSKKTVEPYQQNFNKRVEGVKKGQQSLLNSNLPENQKKWIRENKSPNIQYGLGMGNMDNDYSKELLNKVDTRIKPQNFIRYTVEKPDIDLKDIQSITERNKPQEYMELSNLDRSTSDILLGRNKTIKQKIGDYKGKYDEVVKKLKKTNPNINIEDIVRQSDRFKEAIKQIPGWQTGRIYYDPLAVKPYNMRTPKEREEWEKKYGKPKPKPTQKTTEPQPKVETKKVETKKPEPKPQRETKKDPVVPISKMETPTALNKTVPNLPYRVDYSGNSQYFASDKEGEEFIKNLNKDFMENKISSPGNVSGYYETKKKKNGGWLEKYN